MSTKMEEHAVTIFGDSYTLRTDEHDNLVLHAATLVDTTMKEVVASAPRLDTKGIATLAAVRIAYQLIENNQKNMACHEELVHCIDALLEEIQERV